MDEEFQKEEENFKDRSSPYVLFLDRLEQEAYSAEDATMMLASLEVYKVGMIKAEYNVVPSVEGSALRGTEFNPEAYNSRPDRMP